ncbi:MAG: nuclear transport factor 2 family protein [Gemmatimonadota bacterium]|nr:nuclear transport factor 2 family protein [Gemmatimonadota bacterium]
MRIRILTPFIALVFAACGAEQADQAAMADEAAAAEESQEYASNADAASVAAFVNDWQMHYNMGHGTMVANNYHAADGLLWSGQAGMAFGGEAIAAMLQGGIDMASPQIEIGLDDQVIRGNFAVARGTWSTEATVEGETSNSSGYWMSYSEMIDGEWKAHGLVTTLAEGEPSPNFARPEMPPADASVSLVEGWPSFMATHMNMGHPDMVADRYAEDAIVMAPELVEGRETIRAALTEMSEAGVQMTMTPFAAAELGDDYVTSVGTWSGQEGEEAVSGHYANLLRKNADGTLQPVWELWSTHPGM